MIIMIKSLTVLCVVYGLNRIFMAIFRLPGLKSYKMANKMIKVNRKSGVFDLFFQNTVHFFSKRIRLSESRKNKLNIMLRYFEEDSSPELFAARQISRTVFFVVPAMIAYFCLPVVSMVLIFLAIILYFKADADLERKYNIKRAEIEYELPRFCATILQEIKSNRDVLGMIERYINTSKKALRRELEITLADMKSSNYEAALVRLESRVSLGALSDIVRGLIGVVRGDDTKAYFEMLSHDMDAMELQRLEREAGKQPQKIKKYQFLVLVAMMLMYFVIIAVYLLTMEKPAYL